MSRLISNSRVKEFYINSKKHISAAHALSTASGGTVDPSQKIQDKDPTSKPATALSDEGNGTDNKSSETSIRVTSAAEGQKELESSTTKTVANAEYVKTTKMIPRKQFKTIKKKLQKREHRRLAAIEAKRQQTIQ
ncbi:hypothetical protein BGZ80_005643 [Entomortierella chlamydospora]|uniref:Uncharacterized protein n=1 Tax=Entomortierella chlamydospora TaxID=101097 RepID=A0A9P6T2C5_9FUNG|nr:hypothetical protein BGZ80_005643 [Entomortierella chlamydospora]